MFTVLLIVIHIGNLYWSDVYE